MRVRTDRLTRQAEQLVELALDGRLDRCCDNPLARRQGQRMKQRKNIKSEVVGRLNLLAYNLTSSSLQIIWRRLFDFPYALFTQLFRPFGAEGRLALLKLF